MADELLCVIEIPKGSRNKYEWDGDRGRIMLDRFLSASTVFPTDYGFIPDTLDAAGEDELDVLVAVSEPTFPGCGVIARPVAVLHLCEEDEREPKVVCVPCRDPNWQSTEDLDDLSEQLVEEIEHFFIAYKVREGKKVQAEGWEGRQAATRIVEQARARRGRAHRGGDRPSLR